MSARVAIQPMKSPAAIALASCGPRPPCHHGTETAPPQRRARDGRDEVGGSVLLPWSGEGTFASAAVSCQQPSSNRQLCRSVANQRLRPTSSLPWRERTKERGKPKLLGNLSRRCCMRRGVPPHPCMIKVTLGLIFCLPDDHPGVEEDPHPGLRARRTVSPSGQDCISRTIVVL